MANQLLIAAASLLLIVSACSRSPEKQGDSSDSATSSARQQPSPTDEGALAAGTRDEYVAIKQLIRDRNKEMQDVDKCAQLTTRSDYCEDDNYTPAADEPVVAFDCGFSDGIDGTMSEGETPQSRWSRELLDTAKLSVALEDTATEYGYPAAVWERKLRQFESREISRAKELQQIESGDLALVDQRLAVFDKNNAPPGDDPSLDPLHPYHIVDTDMRAYRQKQNPELREVESLEGCGAGESLVLVRGEPKAQRIRLIPGFFSELCKRTKRALEGDDCPYWFEVSQEQPMDLAGYYRYEARWSSGSKALGTADVDKLHQDEDKEYAELVIRDPKAN